MHRHPADLFDLHDPPLLRLLRACGTPEAILCDASDYDRFLALAQAMSLCEGHPLRELLQGILQDATGLSAPLCPHTAPAYWEAWLEKHWYGREVTAAVPDICPHCRPACPTVLPLAAVTVLPDPMTVAQSLPQTADLAAFASTLTASTAADGYAALHLSTDYAFFRPDPHHAALALQAAVSGRASVADRHLLTTQAIRILGEQMSQRGGTLLLCGGAPDEVVSLLAYLAAARRLPETVYLPDAPADVAPVSGLYPAVRTGYRLAETDSPAVAAERRATYAAIAPIGRAVILTEKTPATDG